MVVGEKFFTETQTPIELSETDIKETSSLQQIPNKPYTKKKNVNEQ